jgi:hypothetical protein
MHLMFPNVGKKIDYMDFFLYYLADFIEFLSNIEDLEPFFRLDIGRKLI